MVGAEPAAEIGGVLIAEVVGNGSDVLAAVGEEPGGPLHTQAHEMVDRAMADGGGEPGGELRGRATDHSG